LLDIVRMNSSSFENRGKLLKKNGRKR